MDVIESVLVDMFASGVMRVLTPDRPEDLPPGRLPYAGFEAIMAEPPVFTDPAGQPYLAIDPDKWGMLVGDEPPPAASE